MNIKIVKCGVFVLGLTTLLAWNSACGLPGTAGGSSSSSPELSDEAVPRKLKIHETDLAQGPIPAWAIGPFKLGAVGGKPMIFVNEAGWKDPTADEDWEAKAFWNPALLEVDGRIYLFYRAGPMLEGLHSRIGVAWSDDGVSWHDYEYNPILSATEDNEELGLEDPRVYKYEGQYYLYYHAVERAPDGRLLVDICVAVSRDLLRWNKRGCVMPRSISRGWAKAPVIPRSTTGEAVKINGEFLMYVSERPYAADDDVKEQMIGHSDDLIHWEYDQIPYLTPANEIESIYEVASVLTNFPDSDDMVMDFYYVQSDGNPGCAQALYDKSNPTKQIGFTAHGLCTWGGVIAYHDQWLFAQGWQEPESIYLYTAPIHRSGM